MCILLYTKGTDIVVHTYLLNIYSNFGRLYKILLDNGTEFNNPKCNRCSENVHNFLKACLWKHVSSELALNKVTHIALQPIILSQMSIQKRVHSSSCFDQRCIHFNAILKIWHLHKWVVMRAFLLWMFSKIYMH